MLLKMLGSHYLELTMPWLRGGPYTAKPKGIFEVDDRDGAALLEGNERLFEQVYGPDAEGEQPDQPSTSPVEEKPRRRKKGASEADGKGE